MLELYIDIQWFYPFLRTRRIYLKSLGKLVQSKRKVELDLKNVTIKVANIFIPERT